VLGLTTIFGNVTTPMATANALHLCEMAGRADVPVAQARPRAAPPRGGPLSWRGQRLTRGKRTRAAAAQGALGPLVGGVSGRIADFVHGSDGARARRGAPLPPRRRSRRGR
jgi:hypothetical protein